MIDPFTEAIQIQGRFRNGFNSLTHISNVKIDLDIMSKEAIDSMIEEFEITHSCLNDRLKQATDKYRKQAISKDMESVKYADLLDEQGNINYFSVDNLYNEERVKEYYKTKESLFNAYNVTNHFNVTDASVIELLGEDDLLTLRKAKTDIEKRRLLTKQLRKLYSNQDKVDISFYLNILRKEDQGTYTIDAFQKIGKEGLEKAGYKKGTIDKAVKEYDKMIHRFLPEVIKDIQSEFDLNVWIEKEEIRDRLEMIYKRHNILYTVKLNTIKDYFLVDETKDKKPYKYILKVLIKDFGIF